MAKKGAHDGGTLGETIAGKMNDPAFAAEYRRRRFVQEVAVAVRKLRESAGLTQAELAGRMGVSQPIIGRLEGAKDHQPRFDLLDRVAASVGLGVKVIFCEPRKPAQPLASIEDGAVSFLRRGIKAISGAGSAARASASVGRAKASGAVVQRASVAPTGKGRRATADSVSRGGGTT